MRDQTNCKIRNAKDEIERIQKINDSNKTDDDKKQMEKYEKDIIKYKEKYDEYILEN